MKEDINETRLANGMVILTDRMPSVRSVTLGVYFRVGSRNEPDELNGITHFIEHAVFKGTKRRSALDIAVEQDRLGGMLEAFTTHEETGFSIKVIDDQLESALDLVTDMLSNPTFDEKEMRSEQKVIIEELKMTDDSPEDRLGEIFSRAFYVDHPLGLNIAGTAKTVKTFDKKAAQKFHANIFHPSNVIIVAAGNVVHKDFVKLVKRAWTAGFARYSNGNSKVIVRAHPPRPAAPILVRQNRTLEQAHLILATPFVSARDMKRYPADLLAQILGGGTSSRLWQKVREERGLAYSVGASTIMFNDCGMFTVAAATSPEQTKEVVGIAVEELRKVVADGVTAEELDLVKQESRAAVLMSLEDSASRAGSLAQSELAHGRQISLAESLANTAAVTTDDIRNLAREYFRTENMAFGALGNLKGLKVNRKQLAI